MNKDIRRALQRWRITRILTTGDFARFCVVGAVGFAINFGALWLLHAHFGIHIVPAQLIGAELALVSNFFFHTHWTYKSYREGSGWVRFVAFHASTALGFAINSLTVIGCVALLHMFYGLALVFGSGLALFVNFIATRYYIWRKEVLPVA